MSDVLNIAVQCNSPEQLIALIAIMIFDFALTVVVLKGIIRFTGMVLSTILHYHNATVKISGASVNAELELHN